MRDIRFRAWDKVNLRMIYFGGFRWHDEYDLCYLDGSLDVPAGDNLEWMQYSGRKDKNGKEMYEGDIMKIHDKVMEVKFFEGCWRTKYGDNTNYRLYGWVPGYIEVIGNIHQNPELLEQTKQPQ